MQQLSARCVLLGRIKMRIPITVYQKLGNYWWWDSQQILKDEIKTILAGAPKDSVRKPDTKAEIRWVDGEPYFVSVV